MTKQKLEKRKYTVKNGLIHGDKLARTLNEEKDGFGPEANEQNLTMKSIIAKLQGQLKYIEVEKQHQWFHSNTEFVRIRVCNIGNLCSWTMEHTQLFKISEDGLSFMTGYTKDHMAKKPTVYMIEDLESVKLVSEDHKVIKLTKNKNLKNPKLILEITFQPAANVKPIVIAATDPVIAAAWQEKLSEMIKGSGD